MRISLPDCDIDIDGSWAQELLLVGGGRAPQSEWLKSVAVGREVWCIDHGIDACQTADIIPARLIGDKDSATNDAWTWAEQSGTAVSLFPPEKDFTDTQLALKMVKEKQSPFVILSGAFGGRFDHLFSTVFSFAHAEINGLISDEQELLLPLFAPTKVRLCFSKRPKAISLLPITEKCRGISINGVKWPLNDAEISSSLLYSVSNELKKDADTISVSASEGILGIYAYWE